jgi:hypothetical protein
VVNNITINSITYNSSNILSTPSNVLTSGNGLLTGSSVTNGLAYNCYAFGSSNALASSTNNYVVNYTCSSPTYIYVLAGGGGGGGGSYIGGGGGAGGIVMMPVLIPSGTNQTITISVGNGGTGSTTLATNGVIQH